MVPSRELNNCLFSQWMFSGEGYTSRTVKKIAHTNVLRPLIDLAKGV